MNPQSNVATLLKKLRMHCLSLCSSCEISPFVRNCKDEHFLFVSNFPRLTEEEQLKATLQQLSENGYRSCRKDNGLCYIDLSMSSYAALLPQPPSGLPPLPIQDELHPACALCRLLLLHPAPLDKQPLSPLRKMLQLCEGGVTNPSFSAEISSIHQEASLLLRQRQHLPYAAGLLLSAWLRSYSPGILY